MRVRDRLEALHPNRYKKSRKAESDRIHRVKELRQLDNVLRTAGKATTDSRSQVLKHILESRTQECGILNKIEQKEIAAAQACSQVEEKLSQFVENEYSVHTKCADPMAAFLDDDPEVKDFARRIRSKVTGLIQHAQIIENEQRRKKHGMETKEQEKCWLEEYTARNCEMELKEHLADINKKKDFREGIIKQIATQPSRDCTNFELERKRCEEVLAKELAEIKAEREASLHRREEIKRSTLEELARRKKETFNRRQEELEFERKKLLEQEALNAATDARRNPWLKTVEVNRRRQASVTLASFSSSTFSGLPQSPSLPTQELAALKLEEVLRADESSLPKQAAKASSEIGLGLAILDSVQEADEVFAEPGQRVKQRDYYNELDYVLGLRKMAIKKEKDREKESDLAYVEACKEKEAKMRREDELQRAVSLEIGKCLRDQIAAKENEARKHREEEHEANQKLAAEQRDWISRVEAAKAKLMDEFVAWRSTITSPSRWRKPTGLEDLGCQSHLPRHCPSGWKSASATPPCSGGWTAEL
ncbi:hypothetical protein TcWFU_000602 [Taenia crassiceps]|uniref:Uncharacterized protein n=1 Tax=Taenia crassiceps TaxID=6207 RepID=A0ABR4Q453_9CEST